MSDDVSLVITKIGETVRIDYEGQRYLPWWEANRMIGEAVAQARADAERVRFELIEADNTPPTCRVWVDGRLVFSGVGWSALTQEGKANG